MAKHRSEKENNEQHDHTSCESFTSRLAGTVVWGEGPYSSLPCSNDGAFTELAGLGLSTYHTQKEFLCQSTALLLLPRSAVQHGPGNCGCSGLCPEEQLWFPGPCRTVLPQNLRKDVYRTSPVDDQQSVALNNFQPWPTTVPREHLHRASLHRVTWMPSA